MTPLSVGRSADSGATRAATARSCTTRMSRALGMERGGGHTGRKVCTSDYLTHSGDMQGSCCCTACGAQREAGKGDSACDPSPGPTAAVPAAAVLRSDRTARASYHTHDRPSSIVQGITTKNKGLSITTARCYCRPTLSSETHGPRKVSANVAHVAHACGGQG